MEQERDKIMEWVKVIGTGLGQRCRHLMLLCAFGVLFAPASAQIVDDVDADDDDQTVVSELGSQEEIAFPESMADNLDSLMNLYMTKTYLAADNDCQTKDASPEYTKEEYIDRLYRMPTVMEMPYNDVVRTYIDRYTSLRRQVGYMLGALNFYVPFFEEALDAYQLPLELKYLPVIESALNPTAVSGAGAAGLWQFMLSAGKAYGLEVNSLVDERRDPVKSSWAAARLLSDLYKIFGDWNLVIAAYNCGPENVNKAIRRSGGERDYWAIYPYLPKETRGYVPAFIAANYVMTYYCEHNICPMKTKLPVKTDTIMLSQNVGLAQVASVCGLDIDLLRSLNPQYRRDVVPGATAPAPLRLPLADVARFIDLQDSILAAPSGLQKRAVVAVADNVAPAASRSGAKKGTRNKKTTGGGAKYVTVRGGDTLSSIARRNGTTVARLRQINGLRGNNIRAGKRIRVK